LPPAFGRQRSTGKMMGYDGRRRGRTAVLTLLYGMACDTSMGGFRARTMPFAQLGGKIAWILQIRARLRAHTNIAGASEAVRARSRWPCRHCHGAKSHGPLPSSGDGRRRGWTAVWALLYEMACDTRMGVFQRKLCGSRAKGGKIASIITAGAWAEARGNMEEHLEQSASGRKSRATRTWRKVPRMAGTP
jgi:hypothetical protein